MSEPTTMPSERVSRERWEAVAKAISQALLDHMDDQWELLKDALVDAAILTLLPERTAFFDAVDELVDVIKGFEPDSTIEDKKIALRDLVYGADDASGGTR